MQNIFVAGAGVMGLDIALVFARAGKLGRKTGEGFFSYETASGGTP